MIRPAVVEDDLIEAALIGEHTFHATSLGPTVPATLEALAQLAPTTLACMHGSSFRGDAAAQLRGLGAAYADLLAVPA